MTTLSSNTVQIVPSIRPMYDRSEVTVGIAHFGFGSFHRAHQAAYVDALMNRGHSLGWGIVGVGVLEHDRHMHDVMLEQDCLYTHVQKRPDGTWEDRIIGSVIEHLHAPDAPQAVVERLADPRIRIVSLTITEGGYEQDATTGEFKPSSPPVLADLRNLHDGASPQSVFGYILSGLRLRFERGIPPFTVLSCDNIQNNGRVAKRTLTDFATLVSPALGDLIEQQVAFPNTMVDRITPITTDTDRKDVRSLLGVNDGWPVVSEPFTQWIIEENFPWGRPPLEEVGVQFVEDVTPYETMKLRLLNASHQALAYPALLLGIEFVHDAATNPAIAQLLNGYMREARTTLPPMPGINLDDYCTTLLERFANPEIRDTTARLAMDAENRLAAFVLPVVQDLLKRNLPLRWTATIIAAYIHSQHKPRSRQQCNQELQTNHLYTGLAHIPTFVQAVTDAWQTINDCGMQEASVSLTDEGRVDIEPAANL